MHRLTAMAVSLLATSAVVSLPALFSITCSREKGPIMNEQAKPISQSGVENLHIIVVYDNNPYKQGLETDWGFSALITGAAKTILFDTGGGRLLIENMEKLEIDPNTIDVVVLSHIHADHTGGLGSFLGRHSGVSVYLPESFPAHFKDNVRSYGAKVVEVNEPVEICENVYSIGQVGRLIKEQALVIRTDKGLVVTTGCAHPGIVKIVTKARDLLNDDILLVMGGFHLEWATKGKIEKVISAFKELGVQYVGPCHCSGEKARDLFEEHFEKSYIAIGAGKAIAVAEL